VTDSKQLTISVPVLNEADNIKPLWERLRAVADSLPRYDFEFLFTDNASTDATFERLADDLAAHRRVRRKLDGLFAKLPLGSQYRATGLVK
jgi:hypothetical protein